MEAHGRVEVIAGASGPLGIALAARLNAAGRAVRAVSRNPPAARAGYEPFAADIADPEAAREACRGASAIYLCAAPPYSRWPREMPRLIRGAIAGASSSGAKLIFADNLYAYGPTASPLHEELPAQATGPKGRARAEAGEALLEAHRAGRIRVAIARAADFFGPGVTRSALGAQVFRPFVAGGTVNLLGNPDLPHSYTYIEDFARALMILRDRDEAEGGIWHVPNAPAITTREFLRLVAFEAGTDPGIRTARGWLIRILGLFNAQLREMREICYQFEQPFVVDHSKFTQAFGNIVTPRPQAIRETIDWYRSAMD